MSNPTALVQKLWNYCSILRDDGLSYGDYVEQLTFLLFLKIADEQPRPPFNPPSRWGFGGTGKPSAVPRDYAWPSLLARIVAEVARRLRVVEELTSVETANLQRAVQLRQSNLQKAFAGQLV